MPYAASGKIDLYTMLPISFQEQLTTLNGTYEVKLVPTFRLKEIDAH